MEKDGKVLVIRRIHVRYHLQLDPAHREKAEQVFGFHADYCPVYRTLHRCIDISTELTIEDN